MNSVPTPQSDDNDVTVTVCPDGPLLVRGPVTLIGADGNPIKKERTTVALCRCRGTAIPPFCDGTHKKRKRRRPTDAEPSGPADKKI